MITAGQAATEQPCGGAVIACCTVLQLTAQLCTAVHYTALHCTALHCTKLHYTALHCTVVQCSALHLKQDSHNFHRAENLHYDILRHIVSCYICFLLLLTFWIPQSHIFQMPPLEQSSWSDESMMSQMRCVSVSVVETARGVGMHRTFIHL